MASLLDRLKERKLVQWAIAYLAGAWAALEATGFVAEQFDWPEVLLQAFTILAVFGFFVVLVLAWYHGEKGRQRVSGPELLMVAALLVIAGGVLSMLRPEQQPPLPAQSATTPVAEDDRASIAVLPFDDFSPDPANAYFADGMLDEITSRLSLIQGLGVKGRTSVERYRKDPTPVSTIAQELNVDFLLEGSARVAGDQVRIVAQLIDTEADEHVWSETYDRKFSIADLFEVQGDIAQQVAQTVGTVLTPVDEARIASRPTENLQAYVSYLRGMESWSEFTEVGAQQAIDHFNRAIDLDSAFAEAYAGLANTYTQLGLGFGRGAAVPHEVMPLAREAAHRAIKFDAGSAGGHMALGTIHLTYDFDYPEAERFLTRAVELDPDGTVSYNLLAHVYAITGRHVRAVETARRGLELDPYEPINATTLGFVLQDARRGEEALAAAEQARVLHPDFPEVGLLLATVYSFRGQYAEAIEALQSIPGSYGQSPRIWGSLGYNYARMGDELAAREILEELLALAESRYVSARWIGYVYMGLREDETALDWLERAVDERADWIVWINLLAGIDRYRSNSRFHEIMRRMNLSPQGGALPG
jgi:serine/threonine-protein kinase